MSTFIVGDVQGCFDTLMSLVTALDFKSQRDELWFVGDLVNRGPKNVEVLRWIRGLGARATVVLGNHDMHLLARAAGAAGEKRRDTLDDVLAAHDLAELVDWLRTRPIVHERGATLMVHAGVLPSWTRETIREKGAELAAALSQSSWRDAIAEITSRRESGLGAISAVLQRVRMIDADERLLDHAGAPASAPSGSVPWFEADHARGKNTRVVFGHWSALGLIVRDDAVCLDTGCVWGRSLTAFNLEAQTVTSVSRAR